ncbi:MAG: hypothetical protein NTZ17_08885 [Phycisphaerae bacterium]|nr:hypothetical protein [Phycisphaerae bacterium]
MNPLIYAALEICAAILNTCPSTGKTPDTKIPTQMPTPDSLAQKGPDPTKKAEPKVLEIQRLAVMDKSVTMNYRVSNTFPEDIWVCEDIDGAGLYGGHTAVETRIVDDSLKINLLGNLERSLFFEKNVWARYRRLPRGQSRSQTIVLTVPVGNYSPVYWAEIPRAPKKTIVLHQVMLKVGFFKEDLPGLLAQAKERNWPFLSWDRPRTPVYTPPESKDPNVVFIPYPWQGTRILEQSAQVDISDVNVPARVAANPKDAREYWLMHESRGGEKPETNGPNPQNNKKR